MMIDSPIKKDITIEKLDNAILLTAKWLRELNILKQEVEKESNEFDKNKVKGRP